MNVHCTFMHKLVPTFLHTNYYYIILQRIPEWFNVCKTDAEKFPEAAFRTGVYTVLWIWAVWIVAKEDLFTNLLNTLIS